jgi:hypothetical protein
MEIRRMTEYFPNVARFSEHLQVQLLSDRVFPLAIRVDRHHTVIHKAIQGHLETLWDTGSCQFVAAADVLCGSCFEYGGCVINHVCTGMERLVDSPLRSLWEGVVRLLYIAASTPHTRDTRAKEFTHELFRAEHRLSAEDAPAFLQQHSVVYPKDRSPVEDGYRYSLAIALTDNQMTARKAKKVKAEWSFKRLVNIAFEERGVPAIGSATSHPYGFASSVIHCGPMSGWGRREAWRLPAESQRAWSEALAAKGLIEVITLARTRLDAIREYLPNHTRDRLADEEEGALLNALYELQRNAHKVLGHE